MAIRKGYAGEILRVDLSDGRISTVPTDTYAGPFLGGRGIAVKIHWDEVPTEAAAFDPENRLVFMTGPVCGVPGLAGSRWQVSARSPFNQQFSYCNLGGAWGAHLKKAGYDGLVVHGRSEGLVYLTIEDDRVHLKDASSLKGRGAIHTREALKKVLGKPFRVAAVGPAGENMAKNATLTADSDSSGSSGLGAVMGSKNLKAIAVCGTNRARTADPEMVGRLRQKVKT